MDAHGRKRRVEEQEGSSSKRAYDGPNKDEDIQRIIAAQIAAQANISKGLAKELSRAEVLKEAMESRVKGLDLENELTLSRMPRIEETLLDMTEYYYLTKGAGQYEKIFFSILKDLVLLGKDKLKIKKDKHFDRSVINRAINDFLKIANPEGLSNIFSYLCKVGYDCEDLSIDYNELVGAINKNLEEASCTSQSLANIFNGLAKFGFEKSDLQGIDNDKLVGAINYNLKECNSQHLANIFNGLAKLGFEKTDLPRIDNNKLVSAINYNLKECNSQNLANIFNSLLSCGFVDLDFMRKIKLTEGAKRAIFFPPEDCSLETKSAFAKICVYFKNILNIPFDDLKSDTRINLTEKDNIDYGNVISHEEEKISAALKGQCGKDSVLRAIKLCYNDIAVLSPDYVVAEKGGLRVYIEYDGPSHFKSSGEETGKTKVRNELYRDYCDNNPNCRFISIKYKEYEKARGKGNVAEFLKEKLESQRPSAAELHATSSTQILEKADRSQDV